MASVASGVRPAVAAAIWSRWAGTMRIHTFATMIVPSMAPVWMYAARPLSTRVSPYTTASSSAHESTVAAPPPSRASGELHTRSYTAHATTRRPIPSATAWPGPIAEMAGSTRYTPRVR